VESTAVDIRMSFAGGFSLVHTIHLAEDGKWKWILPSRFCDYKAGRCPTDSDSGSSPPPANA